MVEIKHDGHVIAFAHDKACDHDFVGASTDDGICLRCHTKKPSEVVISPNGHVKNDRVKTRYDLVPPQALREIADVLTYGATKYTPNNWAKGTDWSRYYNALRRHLEDWWGGEDNDPETGHGHLAHAGCCLLFLMAYQQEGLGMDDRRKVGGSK